MYYYKYNNHYAFSKEKKPGLETVTEKELAAAEGLIYYLTALDPEKSRRSYCISTPSLLDITHEDLQLLQVSPHTDASVPAWISNKASQGLIKAVNTSYPGWESCLTSNLPNKWRINIIGLGDVGSTLLTGLKLLGNNKISRIGIYDIDESKVTRWEFECNQILHPNHVESPTVVSLKEDELFDCDMFVFCVTVGIPAVNTTGIDVRMIQFEGNSKIISTYAKKARAASFQGIFAVVSDPVDLLCKKALIESNTDENNSYDFKGLAPEQIRGYGLGVMHARAAYYAKQSEEYKDYLDEGRAFGPHGEHLVIANSIANYDEDLSLELTERARTANLQLRKHGYKPYVAPALSSGTLSIIETINGNWHYSATYIGGVYMGARNKLLPAGTVIEQYEIPDQLMTRLNFSYKELERIL